MSIIVKIAFHDIKYFFSSYLGTAICAVFAMISGIVFTLFIESYLTYTQSYSPVAPEFKLYDLNLILIQPYLNTISALLQAMIPFFTMKSLAEEQQLGTMQLLLASPISSIQISLGKFLAISFLVFILLLLTLPNIAILIIHGSPDIWPIWGGYLGIFLVSILLCSVGLFISGLCNTQIAAATSTFGVIIALMLLQYFSPTIDNQFLKSVVEIVSISGHKDSFIRGFFSTTDISYFFTSTAIMLGFSSLS